MTSSNRWRRPCRRWNPNFSGTRSGSSGPRTTPRSSRRRQPAGTPAPDGRDLSGRSWSRVRFDIVLSLQRT
ncbi:hypothetical protein EEJ42_04690 [Streptomyces botrytidirepellens]|uniref:Uncharacterized protein n=1 Tax=Streptomyces botrytidirepellens TaxID=2486417 RepID=A0A3M8WZK7_9ACTN|nr:hypothetical protein EEJ42_04690 [Streptomyces botrytidirepellens]